MTLAEFRQALTDALSKHFPQAAIAVVERRDIVLTCKIELDADTFIVTAHPPDNSG